MFWQGGQQVTYKLVGNKLCLVKSSLQVYKMIKKGILGYNNSQGCLGVFMMKNAYQLISFSLKLKCIKYFKGLTVIKYITIYQIYNNKGLTFIKYKNLLILLFSYIYQIFQRINLYQIFFGSSSLDKDFKLFRVLICSS